MNKWSFEAGTHWSTLRSDKNKFSHKVRAMFSFLMRKDLSNPVSMLLKFGWSFSSYQCWVSCQDCTKNAEFVVFFFFLWLVNDKNFIWTAGCFDHQNYFKNSWHSEVIISTIIKRLFFFPLHFKMWRIILELWKYRKVWVGIDLEDILFYLLHYRRLPLD